MNPTTTRTLPPIHQPNRAGINAHRLAELYNGRRVFLYRVGNSYAFKPQAQERMP
jgi:hypothetical protein